MDNIMEILDMLQFFGGQRAARELWADKPKDVQNADIESFNTNIETIREYIQQLESIVPRWISVEGRLPEAHADGSVDAELVTDGEFIHMAYYAHGQWIFCESGEMKEPMWNTVTHWMPLPEPPKEESTC